MRLIIQRKAKPSGEIPKVDITLTVLLAVAVFLITAYAYSSNKANAEAESLNESTVYLCDYKADEFTYSTNGTIATFKIKTPVDKSWAFDFGDGEHSEVLLTQKEMPFEVSHEYKAPGEYVVVYLTADHKLICETRFTLKVEIK